MRAGILTVAVLLLALLTWLSAGGDRRVIEMGEAPGDAARGAYILRLAGCVSCHTRQKTTSQPAGPFLAGGDAIKTPFGVFYGPNITSDPVHGIGAYTASQFVDTLVNGHSATTGHLFPVFPYTSYGTMDDKDVHDLWTYLQSVEAVAAPSTPHEISSRFALRLFMRPWKTLFHHPQTIIPIEGRSDNRNRGRYIVEGIGHCSECHTPRGALGALDRRHLLEGSVLAPGGEKVPALTAEALRRRGYDAAGLGMAFRYGLTPDGDVLGGSMGEVLSDQIQHLSNADLLAISTYLLDRPDQ